LYFLPKNNNFLLPNKNFHVRLNLKIDLIFWPKRPKVDQISIKTFQNVSKTLLSKVCVYYSRVSNKRQKSQKTADRISVAWNGTDMTRKSVKKR